MLQALVELELLAQLDQLVLLVQPDLLELELPDLQVLLVLPEQLE